jgi:chemotaxis family two-component system response regulator Rcp1
MSKGAAVLLVEDSPGDIRLIQESFRELDGETELHFAHDGTEAMAFLRREGVYVKAPRPDLILLDLNLPKMDGLQVLEQIKLDPRLKTIPTIILTTSQAEKDLIRSYQLQANCYLRKPEEWDGFESLMRSTFEFWLKTIKLPLREPDTASFASAGHGRAKPTAAAARSERIAQATERESK